MIVKVYFPSPESGRAFEATHANPHDHAAAGEMNCVQLLNKQGPGIITCTKSFPPLLQPTISRMSNVKAQAEFLFAVLKHSPVKVNIRYLSAACDLSVPATSMRLTRLKKKFENEDGVGTVEAKDLEFLERMVEFSGGKTDVKALAAEMGMKPSAVSMRLIRLRKKFGTAGTGRKGGGGRTKNTRECSSMHMQEKVEHEGREIKCEMKSEGQEDDKGCVFDEHEGQEEELKRL